MKSVKKINSKREELSMRTGPCRLLSAAALLLATATIAYAQGATSTSSLSGTVVDNGGGVLPGATVVAKNNATGATLNAVTNTSGAFSIPALDPGTYTVTVSLQGFKQRV